MTETAEGAALFCPTTRSASRREGEHRRCDDRAAVAALDEHGAAAVAGSIGVGERIGEIERGAAPGAELVQGAHDLVVGCGPPLVLAALHRRLVRPVVLD